MDLKTLLEAEAAQLIEHLKTRGNSLLNTAAEVDRPLLERTLTRAAILGGELLVDPEDAGAKAEMASLVNTLKFMEAKYAIVASRELREFAEMAITRVVGFILKAALPIV